MPKTARRCGPTSFSPTPLPPGMSWICSTPNTSSLMAGQRGPQTTILTPGNYRLNTYLWDLSIYNAVDVAEGFVAVVKSNVIDSVHFGNLVADKPASCEQKTVSTNESGEDVD